MLQTHHLLFHLPCNLYHNTSTFPVSTSCFRPTKLFPVRTHLRTSNEPWLAQLPEPTTPPQEEGPILLPPSSPAFTTPLFGNPDEASPLQVATSVLLTGAISVFLFRSLRRRAKRAKELRLRSTGMKKSMKEEAFDSLKAMQSVSVDPSKPPSPVQALLGGLSAGVIALILYKFTTTVESALNRQAISDNFSARQITITIRTIINGLCYLATFVFGINSIGLILYSGQLAVNSFLETPANNVKTDEDDGQQSMTSLSSQPPDGLESDSNDREQSSNERK